MREIRRSCRFPAHGSAVFLAPKSDFRLLFEQIPDRLQRLRAHGIEIDFNFLALGRSGSEFKSHRTEAPRLIKKPREERRIVRGLLEAEKELFVLVIGGVREVVEAQSAFELLRMLEFAFEGSACHVESVRHRDVHDGFCLNGRAFLRLHEAHELRALRTFGAVWTECAGRPLCRLERFAGKLVVDARIGVLHAENSIRRDVGGPFVAGQVARDVEGFALSRSAGMERQRAFESQLRDVFRREALCRSRGGH